MARNSGINASMELTEDMKFLVTLSYTADGRPFSATVTVDDEATAVRICKNWKKNCKKASAELLKLITAD